MHIHTYIHMYKFTRDNKKTFYLMFQGSTPSSEIQPGKG